jgi:8-oxo-dGTP pyrophosphatase MutT (NUDIX family)
MSKAKQILQILEAAEAPKQREAAGILFRYKNEVFLLKHSVHKKWVTPGGYKEPADQTLKDTAIREMREECGMAPGYMDTGKFTKHEEGGTSYTTFLYEPENKFQPAALDKESEEAAWFDLEKLPQPLHPGLSMALKEFEMKPVHKPQGWK